MILWNILILWISILHVVKAMATTDVNTPTRTLELWTRIRHHCIVTKLMEVNKSLSDQCKKQLRTTPFGWLLNLYCNIEASGRMLEVMLATWNADERAFQVGDSSYPSPYMMLPLYWGCPWRRSQLIAISLMLGGLWWKHCCSPIWRQLRWNGLNW